MKVKHTLTKLTSFSFQDGSIHSTETIWRNVDRACDRHITVGLFNLWTQGRSQIFFPVGGQFFLGGRQFVGETYRELASQARHLGALWNSEWLLPPGPPQLATALRAPPATQNRRADKHFVGCIQCDELLIPDAGLAFTGQKGTLTCTCLQSWPLAGSWILRNVIGHFRDTLMAVCSTPSSPLRVALPEEAATLLKFLLTVLERRHRFPPVN